MMTRILASLTLFVSVLFLGTTFAQAAQEPVGRVLGVKGTATVVHQGSNKAEKLAVNASVFLMDRISTGGQSKVKMQMKDETIVTLGQDGEMVINEFVYKPETSTRKAALKLVKGAVRSFISKMFAGIGSAFEVHTPTAVAGARGTHNLVNVINDRRTLVIGISSITTVGNSDPNVPGEETLTDNHGSYVDQGQPPSPPFVVPDTLLQPLMDQTDVKEEAGGTPSGDTGGGTGDSGGGDTFVPPDNGQPEPIPASPPPPPPPPPAPPVTEKPVLWSGGFLARLDPDTIFHNNATTTGAEAVAANSLDGGTVYNFALRQPGFSDGLFSLDTSTATSTTDIFGMPYYIMQSITGGTDIFGKDMSSYPYVWFEPGKDFFFFAFNDSGVAPYWGDPVSGTNVLDSPSAVVIGYFGYNTPAAKLPTTGTYLYESLMFGAAPMPLGGSIQPFEPFVSVDWKTGKAYGISTPLSLGLGMMGGLADNGVSIFIGSLDRATSKLNGGTVINTGRWKADYYDNLTPRFATGDNLGVQLYGAEGPLDMGGTGAINIFDEGKTAHPSSGVMVGWLASTDPAYMNTTISDNETWNGFAMGMVSDRAVSSGGLTLATNYDPTGVAMHFTPSTGEFTGSINTQVGGEIPYDLSTSASDANAFISPNAFGAFKQENGAPAYIAAVPIFDDFVGSSSPAGDPYEYTTWGIWAMDTPTNESVLAISPWVAGSLTPVNFLNAPTSATAYYSGDVTGLLHENGSDIVNALYGTANLTANFGSGSGSLNGSFDNLSYIGSDGNPVEWVPWASVNANWSGSNSIHGSISDDGAHSGTVNGAFFGPNAEEVGGNWTLSGNGDQAGGVFRARQMTTLP